MKLSEDKVQALLEMLALTKETEPDCDHCLQHMAQFAETSLTGKTIPEGLRCIDEHLQRCGDCREEFEALRNALDGES